MSTLENGLPVKTDNKAEGVQKMLDTSIPSSLNVGRDATTFKYNSDHSKSCNGVTNSEPLHSNSDADPEHEDTSPDISLSSQKTLRYCDVEPDLREHNNFQEHSDSSDTLDEHSKGNQSAQLVYPELPVTQNVSKNSMASVGKPEKRQKDQKSSLSSRDHSESIPEFSCASRPESLSISCPIQETEQEQTTDSNGKSIKNIKNSYDSDVRIKSSSKLSQSKNSQDRSSHHIESDVCLAQNLPHGTITRKGDMIQFVADDLMEKIKKSSPMSHADTGSTSSRRSSVRSTASASSSTSFATSSGVSRSPSSNFQQSPDDIPPIDASAVIDLENHAHRVADSLDLMMGNIRNNLHKMSAITIGCQDAYKRSVDITCDSVDASIKSMYALMAKCEELSSSMKPVEQLAVQIREIKRILDLFEAQITDK